MAMIFKKNTFLLSGLVLGLGLALGGCASTQDASGIGSGAEISDPFEGANRRIFAFNSVVDDNVIHPAVKGYRAVVPNAARNGVHNFLTNLRSPVVFANQVLQGDIQGASTVLVRATVNTFTGFGGILDVAAAEGIAHEGEDFGQTLAVWGVGHGPYLVVPVLGPSSARDYVGYVVDGYADPLRLYLNNIDDDGLSYARIGAGYLDLREQLMDVLNDLEASSIDYYAATRSIYHQRREAQVNDEQPGLAAIPDY